jgi:hypothetical protein
MGTRSTIKMFENGKCLGAVYQQYDGYPSCVGKELADFIDKHKIINGFNSQTSENFANGIGCLFAQFIAKIKTGIGGVYMTTQNDEQEYNYSVMYVSSVGEITIKVEYGDEKIFKGNIKQFKEFCKEDGKDEEG